MIALHPSMTIFTNSSILLSGSTGSLMGDPDQSYLMGDRAGDKGTPSRHSERSEECLFSLIPVKTGNQQS